MGTRESTRQIELNRRRRRNSLKKPPRFLGIARIMRWPRPLGGLLLVVLLYLGAVIWSPLMWLAAIVWGIWAAAAVLDAALRGSKGFTAGIVAIVFGPLGASVVGFLRRRSIRKVPGEGFNWPTTYSLVALALGFVFAAFVVGAALRVGPHGVYVPTAAMGDRIESGDRVLVVPKAYEPVEFVVVDVVVMSSAEPEMPSGPQKSSAVPNVPSLPADSSETVTPGIPGSAPFCDPFPSVSYQTVSPMLVDSDVIETDAVSSSAGVVLALPGVESGSHWSLVATCAVLTIVPTAEMRARMTSVADAPLASVPTAQRPLDDTYVPCVALTVLR